MASNGRQTGLGGGGGQETPEPTAVTPRDLYPTSDIRFVILEVGKLTATVDRLVSDVSRLTDRVSRLERFNWIVATGAVVAILVSGFWLGDKFSQLLEAIRAVAGK